MQRVLRRKVPQNKEADIRQIVCQINETQIRFHGENGHCFGGTHARTQGIVRGTLIVSDDLPSYLKQTEPFSQAGEFPVICRYSCEPSDPNLDDRIPQPRGLAMEFSNVHGEMFEAGKDFPTQDIEFNSTPTLDLADVTTTKEILDLRLKYGYKTKEQDEMIAERSDKELQQARHQTAYRFGDYVVKYNLVPRSQAQKKLSDETVNQQPDGVLPEWLQDFYRDNEAKYLFQVQLLENLKEQPVEYGGTEWDSDKYPWQTVARLVLPKQESWTEERNRFWVDHLRVDPWHGLKSFQPLGSPNRLRRILYPASSAFRREINGKEEINVKNIVEIPGY